MDTKREEEILERLPAWMKELLKIEEDAKKENKKDN